MKHGSFRSTRRPARLVACLLTAGSAAILGTGCPASAHQSVAPPPPPPPSSAGSGQGDRACLRALAAAGVPFVERSGTRGIRTPVEVVGPIRGIQLRSRGKRPALMDCALARALAEAAPLFREAQVTGLSFSAAYDYRTMRGSAQLSQHAHGLAIDVHAFETTLGRLDVERDFPRAASAGARRAGAVDACVGAPASPSGRALRALACRLERHPAFRLILTPDDNYDHRNHFHIESHPDGSGTWLATRSPRDRVARAGGSQARRGEVSRPVQRRRHHHHRHSRSRQ